MFLLVRPVPAPRRILGLESSIRCCSVKTGADEVEGGLEVCSTPAPPSQVLLPTRGGRGLSKVVQSQPEHIIGAYPCVVNVLQDKTLVESYDRVIVCLDIIHTNTNKYRHVFNIYSTVVEQVV